MRSVTQKKERETKDVKRKKERNTREEKRKYSLNDRLSVTLRFRVING